MDIYKQKPIVITMGDPSGISAEIIFNSWLNKKLFSPISFFLIDDIYRLKKIRDFLKLNVPLSYVKSPSEVNENFSNFLPIISINKKINSQLGLPQKKNAKYIINSIERAVDFVIKGQASSILTSPICKKNLIESGFKYLGQTEFISKIVSKKYKKNFNEVMILSTTKPADNGKNLRVGLVTTHIPLKEVSKKIDKNLIIKKSESFISSLKKNWLIKKPIIGICGINPHSGENGMIGFEEKRIVIPAINYLKKKYNIFGPLSADTCFSKYHREKFDGIICLYHDQGLIPVKTLDFFHSVNITGGLPIIRTSPDHGPAFDIAKKKIASNKSLIAALRMAANLVK